MPIALIVAGVVLLSHRPEDARLRAEMVKTFEGATRIEFRAPKGGEPLLVVVLADRDHRRLLYGVRDSYVTARCPAAADTYVEVHVPAAPPQWVFEQVRRFEYHTTCGQLIPPDGAEGPAERALVVGDSFKVVAPPAAEPSACPPEIYPR